MNRWVGFSLAILLLLASCVLGGCGLKGVSGLHHANQPPIIEITGGAVNSDKSSPLTKPYSVTFSWKATDPDGTIDHFIYTTSYADTVDAASSRWKITKLFSATATFQATAQDTAISDTGRTEFGFSQEQEFFVAAVDNQGMRSAFTYRFFNAYTVAPFSVLQFPTGGAGFGFVGPTVTARWIGTDPDSRDPRHLPAYYKLYFKDISPSPEVLHEDQACVWLSQTLSVPPIIVRGDTTSYILKLTVGHTYCLIIKAVDEAGAEEPYPTLQEGALYCARNFHSLTRNAAFFKSSTNISGPTLGIRAGLNSGLYTGYDPTHPLKVEVPNGVPLFIQWLATAAGYGGEIAGYRYALDIDDPTSDAPHVIQPGGYTWTPLDVRATSAVVSGFPTRGTHYFYVEVFDNSGFRSIAVVQIDVVQASFNKPLLFIIDDPGITLPGKDIGCFGGMGADEMEAWWRDVLETDRYFLDLSDTLTYPGGRCLPMTGKVDFYIPRDTQAHPLDKGVMLSLLAKYRVVIWYAPKNNKVENPQVLHQLADPNNGSGLANNLFIYMQAGGNVWLHGGGAAIAMCETKPAIYAITPLDATQQRRIGPFVLDGLGLRGSDTLFTSLDADRGCANDICKLGPEYDGSLRAVDPSQLPFQRFTANGKERTFMPAMSLDQLRYLDTTRVACRQVVPAPPNENEILSGFPDGYNSNPDSATWQPVGVYRSKGPLAVRKPFEDGSVINIDGAVTGWYKRGTFLTTRDGAQVQAPYQLYFYGIPLHLMFKEEVRGVADIVLSTRGWNIWRGGCPSSAARVTRQRVTELRQGWDRISLIDQRRFRQEARAEAMAQMPNRRGR